MDRFCRSCGASLTQDSRFCPSCGHDVGAPAPDPAERFFSPPPPARSSRRRPWAWVAGALVVLVAIVAGAYALGGDGKNSGNVKQAFGGLSDADMKLLAEWGKPSTEFVEQKVLLIQAETDQDVDALSAAADAMRAAADDMAATALEFENPGLRRDLMAYSRAAVDIGIAFESYGDYAADESRPADPAFEKQIGEQIERHVGKVQEAETRFYNHLADYLSPEQRKVTADFVRDHQQRVEDASE
jgi:hypothetical protein